MFPSEYIPFIPVLTGIVTATAALLGVYINQKFNRKSDKIKLYRDKLEEAHGLISILDRFSNEGFRNFFEENGINKLLDKIHKGDITQSKIRLIIIIYSPESESELKNVQESFAYMVAYLFKIAKLSKPEAKGYLNKITELNNKLHDSNAALRR